VTWSQLKVALIALRNVVKGLERFLQAKAKVKGLTEHTAGCLHDNCNVSKGDLFLLFHSFFMSNIDKG